MNKLMTLSTIKWPAIWDKVDMEKFNSLYYLSVVSNAAILKEKET